MLKILVFIILLINFFPHFLCNYRFTAIIFIELSGVFDLNFDQDDLQLIM